MWVFVCEAVYDRMVEIGLDDETEAFEEILNAVVEHVCAHRVYGIDDISPLERGVRRKTHKIRARYPDGECRECFPNAQEVFLAWRMSVTVQIGDDWKLWELLGDLEATARKAKEDWYYADRVSAGEGAGAGAGSTDGEEPLSDPDGIGDGAADRGHSESEAGAAEAELLDPGTEDGEGEADWPTGAVALRFEGECGDDLGLSGKGSGEAPHEAGSLEGRKKSFQGLPPMSEYRTTLYAQGVCG